MSGPPLIGLTCAAASARDGWPPALRLNRAYVEAIARAGGAPTLIPPLGATEALRTLFDRVDAILLPGGTDLQPALYGAPPHPKLEEPDPLLDATELQLAQWALAEGKPVLGICRGQQVLNVAAGGTLVQDIPTELHDALAHHVKPRHALAHPITVEAHSRLASLLGATELAVNSLHHQAVAEVGVGWMVTARAPDGVPEGLERPDHPFAVAVQFHPEELVPGHAASERLFRGFVLEAAAARRR